MSQQTADPCDPADSPGGIAGSKLAASTCVWQLRDPVEYDEKASKAEIEMMRQWVAEQDMQFLEVGTSSCDVCCLICRAVAVGSNMPACVLGL